MSSVTQRRNMLIAGANGLDWQIKRAREQVAGPFNMQLWCSVLGDVCSAYVVGLGGDERVLELATLVSEQLLVERIEQFDAANPLAVEGGPAPEPGLTGQARSTAHAARGLVRWILTAAAPTEELAAAATAYAQHHQQQVGSKKTWLADPVDRLVMLLVGGNRADDVRALFERPQLASRPTGAPAARSAMDIGRAWASEQREGLFIAAERVHASSIRKAFKAGDWVGLGIALYFTALVRRSMPKDVAGVRRAFEATAPIVGG